MEAARRSFPAVVVATAHPAGSPPPPRIEPTPQMDEYLLTLPNVIKNCEKNESSLKNWARSLQTVIKTSEDLSVSGGGV